LEVVTAVSAQDAFQALDRHASEPVLVLTDVLMPGMDGLSLARKLITRLERSKIVIMSGHLTDISWWPADLRELVFLAKPFRISEVSSLVEIAVTGFNRSR
jgi:two-component system cell cycle sensor histidine kinase/response regulator CckA